MQAEKLSHF